MKMKTKPTPNKRYFLVKNLLTLTSLLFMTTIVFFPLISMSNGTLVEPNVQVGNEAELLNAINTAPNKTVYVISLSENIILKNSLEIPENKNIKLTTVSGTSNFVTLIGADGMDTIIVRSDGAMALEGGIVVTHAEGEDGRGVYVERKGTLVLSGGEITGNTINDNGGGVYNVGTFKMSGGVISGNNASTFGGGVYNSDGADFVMSGGEITRNTAGMGGGVHYYSGSGRGSFTLSGGEIFGNTANRGYNSDFNEVFVERRPYFGVLRLLFIGIIIVVVVGGLLFYRSKKQKQPVTQNLDNSIVA
jgi:hypothetical protein